MIDLMSKKYYFFALSILLLIAGVIGYFVNGIQMDIQFKGGSIVKIQLDENVYNTPKALEVTKRAAEVVKTSINEDPSTVQISQTLNSKETGKKIDLLVVEIANALQGDKQIKLLDALKADEVVNIKADAEIEVQNVQPFIGKEIRENGLKAAFWAALLIILYIWWRFKAMSGLPAGVTAVIALLHDAGMMLSFYILFKIPLNDSFIAAVLTILGYSMNDTVVIYDRIRENSILYKKMPFAEIANRSVWQTLSRSINTSVTVIICILTVYIFAVVNNIEPIIEFTLPMIVGTISGCYSTIFIATPLWVVWKEHQAKKRISAKSART